VGAIDASYPPRGGEHVTTLSTRLVRKIEQKIPNEWGKGVPAQKGGGIRYTDSGNRGNGGTR
jgi:hypothetical protein